LRILGKATSINVRKVLWTGAELGLSYRHEAEAPELAANPNKLVPVIVDGDFVLWESNSIIRYLANKWQAEALYPREPRARANVDRWIDWQATEFNGSWRYAVMAIVRKAPGFDDPAQIEASLEAWNRMMGIVDAQLAASGGYIAGRHFTLADIPIALSVNRWFLTPMERPRFAAVTSYYERLKQRWHPLSETV
jgi:glutathione S-transferase